MLFGHLVTRYGLGAYLTQPLPGEGHTYEKVGIAWYPGKLQKQVAQGFSIGANIKAHGFRGSPCGDGRRVFRHKVAKAQGYKVK